MIDDEGWRRLSPRKLLIDPVSVLRQTIVPLIAVIVGLSSSGNSKFLLLATPAMIVGAVLLGTIPWLTTYYRIDEQQFQQKTGLLNKKTSTAPLERVRSVDLEASLLHRLLGLRKVQIGTGVDDERIVLDAVTVAAAGELRGLLLTGRDVPAASGLPGQVPSHPVSDEQVSAEQVSGEPVSSEQVLATLDLSWVRFAPFSLTRLVIVAGVIGFFSQFFDDLPFLDAEHLSAVWRWVTGFAVALVVVVALVGALLSWVVVAVSGYLAQWWALRLTREHGSLHLSSGLFTTKSITVEEKRVRGVELQEAVLVRLVGGAELSTLATGVENGVTGILPPCPVEVATTVAGEVLRDNRPMVVPLRSHGRAARRRAHIRHQWLTLALLAALAAVQTVDQLEPVRDALPLWVPLALVVLVAGWGVLLAEATYAHLGHALTEHHLVVGSGATTRVRTALERDGVIGWVVRQSFFQRRLGLATLVATTAAGAEEVVLRDVAHDRALWLAHTATPGTLTPFLAPAPA